MNNLLPLKYYLPNDLLPLKYCFLKGGSADLAEFIPYSDHYKMTEEKRIAKPLYCPDTHPFLCNDNSNANGLCRRTEIQCNRATIPNDRDRVAVKYMNKKSITHSNGSKA